MSRQITLAVLALLVLGGLFITLRPEGSGAGPQARQFDVNIAGGAMTPSELSVREGDTVTLRVRADRELELHLHGYDKDLEVVPGETATLEFTADKTGSYEIEDHDAEDVLGRLNVQPREGS